MPQEEYRFEKLEIYKMALELIVTIYKLCEKFPKGEEFGLTSQGKRAVTSIALNIAEGSAAGGDREFRRFINMSIRSLVEVKAVLHIATSLNFLTEMDITEVLEFMNKLFFKLLAFKKSLSNAVSV